MREGSTDLSRSLAEALRREVDGEVRFDSSSRALWATDASNYRTVPLGVVLPRSRDALIAAVACCATHDVPVVARGGGTSTGGQAVGPGVVVDTSRYLNRVLSIDPTERVAHVEPGVVLDVLQAAAAPHGLRFGPDPSTHDRCTVGGMLGNNACGAHSLRYGKSDDNVERLEVLCYDGTLLDVASGLRPGGPAAATAALSANLEGLVGRHGEALRRAYAPLLPRRVSGYGLQHLFPEGAHLARALVGSEGTCVTILEATLRLVAPPEQRALVVLAFADVYEAAAFVPALLPLEPLTIEGIDERVVALSEAAGRRGSIELLGAGGAWLLVEVGGASPDEAVSAGERLVGALAGELPRGAAQVVGESLRQRAIWRIREDGAGLATRLPGGGEAFPGFEDAAVPPEQLAAYLRDFDRLLLDHGRRGVHYGHYGEGCVHVRLDFDFLSSSGVGDFRRFIEQACDLVVHYGGSLSGEHGDGQARSEFLYKQYGPEVLTAFAAFKAAFDPRARMNPGRIVDARPIDTDLRIVPQPPAIDARTHLALLADGGDLAAASRRCVGVGRCRRPFAGGMCPSFQATGEERHSTRGRARLLAEMLRGEIITRGWRSPEVAEALDLCLACKACRSDCPVGVDMAAYKAEFLSRHFAGRLRPPSHYSLGFMPLWLRFSRPLRSDGPTRVLNALLRRRFLRRLGGLDLTRRLPPLAPLRRQRRRGGGEGERVVLFEDTFTSNFEPQVTAAAEVLLRAAGFSVEYPAGTPCCALTWYTTGQLRTARVVARRTLALLRPAIEQGLPIVTLEPSCASMLREDLVELFPVSVDAEHHHLARRLGAQLQSLGEILAVSDLPKRLAPLHEALFAQIHCHEQAAGGYGAESTLLAGLAPSLRTSVGCCGLAGSFGVEAGHGDLSRAIATQGTLRQLDEGPRDAHIVADGFSCRAQLRELSGRPVRHLAELLREALVEAPEASRGAPGRD